MLLHFERQGHRPIFDRVMDRQRVEDRRKFVGKLDVDHRADHLNDFAAVHAHSVFPPAISSSSFVILPCLSLLYSSDSVSISVSALSVAFFIDTMRALCSLAFALSRT